MYYVCSLAHYAYRYRIGIGLQQKIGKSVSVENDALGLTLVVIHAASYFSIKVRFADVRAKPPPRFPHLTSGKLIIIFSHIYFQQLMQITRPQIERSTFTTIINTNQ